VDAEGKKSLLVARFKRAKLLYQLKMYDQALEDLNELVENDQENPNVHFYMGKIMSKRDPHTESVIHFEQVIKHSEEPFLSCNALLEIAKLRIKERDFYEAHYNLKRIALFNFKSAKLDQYHTFTEGVLYLIKRKVKKGVELLSSLIETVNTKTTSSSTTLKPKMREPTIVSTSTLNAEQTAKDNLDFFLKPLVFIYRAYGYIALESYEKAISDLLTASKLTKIDLWSQYNKLLALGFSRMQKNLYEEAQTIFKKASFGEFKKNKEPYLLQVISLISSVTNSDINNDIINVDLPHKRKVITQAIKVLNSAIEQNKEDLSLFYYRGLLFFYLHKFFDAFLDFDYIVEKEEEPMWKYYLARGRWYSWLSMFPEAVKDLTAAITLDEECLDAYLNRGKWAYLLGDTPLSFLDFQKLIMIEPKNPLVHVYAGNLLMTTGSYDDAAKAFTNADSVKKCALAIYQRARWNIALSEIEEAMKDLNIVMELNPHDKIAYTDKECLYAITQAMNIFKQNMAEDVQKLEISKIANILTRLTNKDFITSNLNSKNIVTRTHAQIIPNVKRIKLEKLRMMTYLKKKEKDKYIAELKDEKEVVTRDYSEKDLDLVSETEKITPFR
jgi:tetratricopeptide (TPR) repeat protein